MKTSPLTTLILGRRNKGAVKILKMEWTQLYNTVEGETSRYLQLEDPASDEDQNFYVNVDTQEGNLSLFKEKIPEREMPIYGNSPFDRTSRRNADSKTPSVGKECSIQKLPPLPPKRHVTRISSATTEHDCQ